MAPLEAAQLSFSENDFKRPLRGSVRYIVIERIRHALGTMVAALCASSTEKV